MSVRSSQTNPVVVSEFAGPEPQRTGYSPLVCCTQGQYTPIYTTRLLVSQKTGGGERSATDRGRASGYDNTALSPCSRPKGTHHWRGRRGAQQGTQCIRALGAQTRGLFRVGGERAASRIQLCMRPCSRVLSSHILFCVDRQSTRSN